MGNASPQAQKTCNVADGSAVLSLTLDNLLEGCMLLGFDWTYLYVNHAAATHGKQQREKLIGRTILEMYPGVELSEVFQRYRVVMEQRIAQRFESSYTFTDGNRQWYEFSVSPVPEGIFVLSLDITERKRIEGQLQKTAQELQRELDYVKLTSRGLIDLELRNVELKKEVDELLVAAGKPRRYLDG